MTEDDRRGAGDRRRGPRRVDDQDVPVPIPDVEALLPEHFRARARWHRIHAEEALREQQHLDAATHRAEAHGLELAADELEGT